MSERCQITGGVRLLASSKWTNLVFVCFWSLVSAPEEWWRPFLGFPALGKCWVVLPFTACDCRNFRFTFSVSDKSCEISFTHVAADVRLRLFRAPEVSCFKGEKIFVIRPRSKSLDPPALREQRVTLPSFFNLMIGL